MTFLILNNDIIKHKGVAGKHCEWLLNATNSLINVPGRGLGLYILS